MRVAVTGGTGFVGCRLLRQLLASAEPAATSIVVLSRRPEIGQHPALQALLGTCPASDRVSLQAWDPTQVTDELVAVLEAIDVVVHLAGTSIFAKRWSDSFKRELADSRIISSRVLVDAMRQASPRPSAVISASGIG